MREGTGGWMRWWKKDRPRASAANRCELCRAELPPSSEPKRFMGVYVSDETQRSVEWICATCWQRHLELESEAEARFSRANPVEAVCAALRDGEVSVRREAAGKLARLRDPRAVEPLFDALGREELDLSLGASAAGSMIRALGAIGGDEAEERLRGLLRDEAYWLQLEDNSFHDQPSVAPVVVWVNPALFTAGGSGLMLRGLLDVLGDQRKVLRKYAARELEKVAWRSTVGYGLTGFTGYDDEFSEADRRLIVGPLRLALRDDDPAVRESAATALKYLRIWLRDQSVQPGQPPRR